ncbi:MAG TPA: hypothetical protein VED59_00535 [Acidimicrobiales bacterium]|nr:hypothetical protein [Acidimicrobiales bacterium]
MARSAHFSVRRSRLVVLAVAVAALSSVWATGRPAAASQAPGTPYVNWSAFFGYGDLAFVSLGDLYVLNGTGGQLVNVTGPGRAASDPEFSPNGEWLIYETGQGETYWLARADGLGSEKLPGAASWLPNGQLAVSNPTSTSTFSVTGNEALERTGGSAEACAVSAGRSVTYVFVTSTLRVHLPEASRGVERVETAPSPNGRRTFWYGTRVSFTAAGGLEGTFVGNVSVLPSHRGLVLTISDYCCDCADGQDFYELRSPLGRPQLLGVVLNSSAVPTFGPDGTFAFEGGGDRYAWVSKHVELCVGATAICTNLPAPKGELSISPAWSPDQRTLALVEARAEPEGAIGQPQILQWYATHHLYLLPEGSNRPVEVPHTQGAATPVWSANSQSLLYVDDDTLYLLAHVGSAPVEVAGPLFAPDSWTGYFGDIAWARQFAWSQAATPQHPAD